LYSASYALDLNTDPAAGDYFFGQAVGLPLEEREKVFLPADNRANFTFFDGVDHVTVEEGKLSFTLAQKLATLGWGDYAGGQRVAEIQDMWQQENTVKLRLRQSAGQTNWKVSLWRDGRRLDQVAEAVLKGTQWRELEFQPLRSQGANPDGLKLLVEGEIGARIELEWVKLGQRVFEGYCRTEFVLPEGKIWRAVADVGSADQRHWMGRNPMISRLYINGRVVKRRGARHLYHTAPVDIASYLRPGRNCLGFYGFRIGYNPFLYFQARVIMESGEVVTVASGPDWKYSPRETDGWSQPGFGDSAWSPVHPDRLPWITSRDAGGRLGIPAYNGRLVIKNPQRRDLFYADTQDVVVEVYVPQGLRNTEPTLFYLLGQADAEGRCERIDEGSVSSFAHREGSLVYRLNLGRQRRGVYGLALTLKDSSGSVIDERTREPLVVLRKLDLTKIGGNDYTEGLDLELEDTIDFTDPDDPHPWFESIAPQKLYGQTAGKVEAPTIVRKGALVYREVTDASRGSGYSYRFQFEQPGSFYFMELEYPDNAKRTIEVQISSKIEGVWTNSQAGVGAETGGRFLPTGRMQKLRWIHVADPGPHSVDLINVVDGEKAAAKSLKIYRIKGDLPAVRTGTGRSYGIHTERCFATSGIGMNFGVGMPRNREASRAEDEELPPIQSLLKDLVWMHRTSERYVQYLKFAGQNCHVMGCIQYSEYNTPYVPAPPIEDSRVLWCLKTMLANALDLNGIDFYSGVEFSQSQDVRSYANDAQVANGADTVWMVNARGEQLYGHELVTIVPNWLHTEVRDRYNDLLENLSGTFSHLSHYRGVHGLLGPSQRQGYWIPGYGSGAGYEDPFEMSFDDVTIGLFEEEAGIRLPIAENDPQRFEKRAALLRSPATRDRFIRWRGKKLREFLDNAVQTLRRRRKDLELASVLAVEDPVFFRHLIQSEKSFGQLMKEFAVDLDELRAVDGLRTGHWTISWRSSPWEGKFPSQNPYLWFARTSPEVVSAFGSQENPYVFVRTSWDENMFPTGGHAMKDRNDHDRLVESDWIMNGEKIRALPQPGGYHCREAFVQALVTSDPQLLIGGFTDLNINVGHEQMLRSVLGTFTHLPREEFEPVLDTGLDTNLAIRKLSKEDESYLYVVNPCQWHVTGNLTLRTDGDILEIPSGRSITTNRTDGSTDVPVRLTPFGLLAFRVTSPRLEVVDYRTEPLAAAELDRLRSVLSRMQELLLDPRAKLGLALRDRRFLEESITRAQNALGNHEYARAWSILTHHRVWNLWQDFLETASTAFDSFPASQLSKITYDPTTNCMRVVGFPEDTPATMDTLLDADRENGWNKLSYDERTETYTVDADLWIGDDQSAGTFVQMGDSRHRNVTVVVKGTVWVRPPRESPKRSDGRNSVINRLTLGDPHDAGIRATLKIDCQTPGEHGVYVGYRSHDSRTIIHRGALHVYNSTITAANQDEQHVWGVRDYTDESASPRWATPGWYASEVILSGAIISWFQGCVTYGCNSGKLGPGKLVRSVEPDERFVIRDTTFEHGGSAVQNGTQHLRNCTFRDLEAAVAEGGALCAKIAGCTFQDNKLNWTLGSINSGGIEMVDCHIGPQAAPVMLKKNSIDPEAAAKRKIPIYPACLVRESVVVKVVDAAGNPVPDSFVTVSCQAAPQQVSRGATITGQDGLTPSDPEANAIVVTVEALQATDDPQEPRQTTFDYEVSVTKPGFPAQHTTLRAGQPIAQPIVIRLR
jgi:hypothetical protein